MWLECSERGSGIAGKGREVGKGHLMFALTSMAGTLGFIFSAPSHCRVPSRGVMGCSILTAEYSMPLKEQGDWQGRGHKGCRMR